jgi:hypothetical protein
LPIRLRFGEDLFVDAQADSALAVVGRHYASAMTAKVTIGAWTPLPGSLPAQGELDKVYVIPTRKPGEEATGDFPYYTDNVRYLPKEARAADLPVEFSIPEGSRKYLQEFSIDPETWSLGLALLTMANEWLIPTVERFIEMRSKSQGWTSEEAHELPLKVSIVKMDESSSVSETYEIEGPGTEVLEALRILKLSKKKDKRGK